MRCLQICNALWGSKVHRNLYQSLDELNITQVLFSSPRKNKKPGEVPVVKFSEPDSKIIGSRMIKSYHRIFFRFKIRALYNDLKKKVDFSKISIAHATTLLSDGALALKIFKKYHIPYIVAVRATDINVFFKYRPDLIFLVHQILKNASRIVFISDALQENFYSHSFIQKYRDNYIPKSTIINNGVDSFWLSNIVTQKKENPYKILFVGRFTSKKNIPRLVKAIVQLKRNYKKLQLNIVGGKGRQQKEVISIADQFDWIKFHGPVYDKQKLLKIYRANHIFAMPSFNETFGLVYVEALSQGLPILYAKGDGFDGIININIGEAVDAMSINDISEGLKKLINHYDSYKLDEIDLDDFNWLKIANKYKTIYQNIS